MYNYLTSMPSPLLFILLGFITISISILAIVVLQRFRLIKSVYEDDPILGSIGTLIGTIYGVLAGLASLYLVNNINYASEVVQREANAIADVYRDADFLQDPVRAHIKTYIQQYVIRVTEHEWVLMQQGHNLHEKRNNIIDQLTRELIDYHTKTNGENLLVHDMLDQIRIIYDARQARIRLSSAQLSPEIWVVILIGTILTLGINFLFRMQLTLHLVAITAISLMASSLIFLLISLDRPFQGTFIVGPEAFLEITSEVAKQN